jgi:hypothetical protein
MSEPSVAGGIALDAQAVTRDGGVAPALPQGGGAEVAQAFDEAARMDLKVTQAQNDLAWARHLQAAAAARLQAARAALGSPQ